jgi:putative membrane protein
MYWYNTGWGLSFFGMSLLWWLFWLVLIAMFFSLASPKPRWRDRRDRALAVLARRYAAGEIDTAEYEARRERILRDLAQSPDERRHLPPPGAPPSRPAPPSPSPPPLSSTPQPT